MGSGVRVELGLGDGRVLVVRLVVGIEWWVRNELDVSCVTN